MFESAIFLAVKTHDIAVFDRNMAQVKIYYNDYWYVFSSEKENFRSLCSLLSFAESIGSSKTMAPSDRQPIVLGLNLMRLIARNQIADYHAELELLSPHFRSSQYIQYAMGLERCETTSSSSFRVASHSSQQRQCIATKKSQNLCRFIVEGNYNRLRVSAQNVPHASFTFFVQVLLPTVREEVAACTAASYESITKSELRKFLIFNTDAELDRFISS